LRFFNPDAKNFTKTNLNTVPKMGPGGMHSLVSRSHFLDRLAVPKMRPQNRKINSKGRPVGTKTQLRLFKQKAFGFGTEEACTCEA